MIFIKGYFNFNKRQERGVLVLSIIFLISIVVNHFAPKYFTITSALFVENAPFLSQLETKKIKAEKEKSTIKSKYPKSQSPQKKVKLKSISYFDPNKISSKRLLKMGISQYVVNNMMKYRDKGGIYKEKKDLAKIYGMEDHIYMQLEPFIDIDLPKPKRKKNLDIKKWNKQIIAKREKNKLPVDIATADSIKLLRVIGIGPFYTGAIVKYRNSLGGYININQLKELYKMNEEKFEKMKKGLCLKLISIHQLPLNTANFKKILSHPYISYETTKYIVNKRKKLGKFSALYQLKHPVHFPDSLYAKLQPYISIE